MCRMIRFEALDKDERLGSFRGFLDTFFMACPPPRGERSDARPRHAIGGGPVVVGNHMGDGEVVRRGGALRVHGALDAPLPRVHTHAQTPFLRPVGMHRQVTSDRPYFASDNIRFIRAGQTSGRRTAALLTVGQATGCADDVSLDWRRSLGHAVISP